MTRELKVRGLMNVQFAVKGEDVYVLEVNPRASRTVPFVSKAIGVPLAKLAAKVMAGKSLPELGFIKEIVPKHYSVKEAVFPFLRYEGVDISLGPEMKSTGEVMGMDVDLGLAYAKSQMAAPPPLPTGGNVFVSVKDSDKQAVVPVVREFVKLGFGIIATACTFAVCRNITPRRCSPKSFRGVGCIIYPSRRHACLYSTPVTAHRVRVTCQNEIVDLSRIADCTRRSGSR